MEKHFILVVDDNREILTTIGALLQAEGYLVDFAFDGEEALEKIATGAPDLILTDIFMPGMGGLELAEALKRDPRLDRIPILAMSAIGEYETGQPRKDLLADDFIRKPPAKQELLDKVEALLHRDQTPSCGGMSAPAAPPATVGKLPPVSERMYRRIAENSFDWQLWMAPGDRVLYCSASSLQITGYSPEQFTADPRLWNTIVHPLDRNLWRDHRAAARAGAPAEEVQFRIVTKDGQTKWIGHICGPVRDEEGHFLGTLSSNRDISDRKALEARLLRAQRLETVGALTVGIVHDVNNILTPILLGIEVLRDRLPDEASRRVFESMESSARRGADLLHQMLSLNNRLHLPAAPLRPPVEAAEKLAAPPAGNGELLLLIDDEGVIREASRAVLEGHGYRVVCAGGGPEALAIYAARWQEISLVLTDLMMPVMDGRSTMQALKTINPQAKVIAMSGLAHAHGRADEPDREFAAFLPKPFSVATLLGTIHDVLNRRDSHGPAGDEGGMTHERR